MPNGPKDETTKKLLNNAGLRSAWASLETYCDTAEREAKALGMARVIRLCKADKKAVKAMRDLQAEYERVFAEVEGDLIERAEL